MSGHIVLEDKSTRSSHVVPASEADISRKTDQVETHSCRNGSGNNLAVIALPNCFMLLGPNFCFLRFLKGLVNMIDGCHSMATPLPASIH